MVTRPEHPAGAPRARHTRRAVTMTLGVCLLGGGLAWPDAALARGPVDPSHLYGVFLNLGDSYRRNYSDADEYAAARDNPLVDGVQANIDWATLEPEPDVYDWSSVEALLARYGAVGKSVGFKFTAVSGTVYYDNQSHGKDWGPDHVYVNTATPAWYWDIPGVWYAGDIQTDVGVLPKYPVFWDPIYSAPPGRTTATSSGDGSP